MKPARKQAKVPATPTFDDLLHIELQVAKRADRLWRRSGYGKGRDLIHWLQAEGEVLEQYFGLMQPAGALAAAKR
jgi:hypothetical protein